MPSKSELHEQLKTEVNAAKAIQAKAAGRALTAEERTQVQRHVDAAKAAKAQLDDAGLLDAMDALGAEISGGGQAKSYRDATVARRSPWVKSTLERIEKRVTGNGAKALTSGSIDVATPIETGVVTLPDTPVRVLDLITDRPTIAGNTFNYLRQTVRTDNAAPVADNAEKPTSVYTFAEVEGRVRVVAHLSEAFPKRYLDDHVELGDVLESEMERGLLLALEEQIVSGDGTGENFTGLLSTSGILSVPFATDVLTTARKAQTAMAVAGERPTAWVVNPADAEAIDLLTDGMERHYYDGPRQVLTTAPLWSAPVVQSLAVPAGTALLADWNQVRLVVRQDATLDVDMSGDLFTHNQVKLRVEGRYGLALRRATAVAEVALAAAG